MKLDTPRGEQSPRGFVGVKYPILHIDFETYSDADLLDIGAFRYASDPSAQIMLAAIALNDEEPVLWVHPEHESLFLRSEPRALELMEMWEDPKVRVYAHNAQFEIAMSHYRMTQDIGVVPPKLEQWRCTQVMARRAAIPASLAKCSAYLNLEFQKDSGGLALIKRFCGPQKVTKKQPLGRIFGTDDPDRFKAFAEYCLQDVRTEQAVHKCLSMFELSGALLDAFFFDIRMNLRGIPVNRHALLNAQVIIDEVLNDRGAEFRDITGLNVTQVKKVTAWFQERGYPFKGMGAEYVEEAMQDIDKWAKDETTKHALQIRSELAFAAIAKVSKMLECDCGDGRVRGCFVFYGAGPGRWAAKLIQPQNFKRPSAHLKKHTAAAYQDLIDGCSREWLELAYGDPLDVISSSIRHFIQWMGGDMFDADYASIEARIVCWLAGQDDAIARFRDNIDSYVFMATKIWPHLSIEDIVALGKDCLERFVGKQAVLGCGYQMGAPKFQGTCANYGQDLPLELCEATVAAFRKTYDKVAKLWSLCERAARNAILHPGRTFAAGPKLKFTVVTSAGITFLAMRLPSGRNIVYPEPMIEAGGKFGDQITFYGQIQGKSFWGRISTYGGKLVENATQGTAFDIMANGSVQADRAGFEIVGLIHDEALALGSPGANLDQFEKHLTTLPPWAEGLPIETEGKIVKYYTK